MYRKFLDPTTDITFKKLFGNKNKKDIVIDFLNSILDRKSGHKITTVTFTDPYNHPETDGGKLSIVDIKCKDEADNTYIIEMQVVNEPDYLNRAQYYTGLEVSRQLDKGDKYKSLSPVIFIAISNFKIFKDHDYLSHHLILNTKTHKNELNLMEFHFIELTKFKKKIEELDSIIDQWTYLLKNASKIDEIPKLLKKNKAINHAFETLAQSNFSRAELEAYDKSLDIYRLELSRSTERSDFFDQGLEQGIELGTEKGIQKGIVLGIEQGIQKGIELGIEQGIQKGIEQGQREKAIKVAKKLKKMGNLSLQEISEMADLSEEEIKNLK